MSEHRNNRNRTIRFNDRNWSHQQAQALLRALGASGEVKVAPARSHQAAPSLWVMRRPVKVWRSPRPESHAVISRRV